MSVHSALATPEILHIICDFLETKDLYSFRLVCSQFAAVGACYAFQELVIHFHKDDFDMLRHFAEHEGVARNVRSLIYIGDTLRDDSSINFPEFAAQYMFSQISNKDIDAMITNGRSLPALPGIKIDGLKPSYDCYEQLLATQKQMLQDEADVAVIKFAVSRFPQLRDITMSLGDDAYEVDYVKGKTPFRHSLVKPDTAPDPVGCRQLETLLSAISASGGQQQDHRIRLKSLTAGHFSWSFFDNNPVVLSGALAPCSSLTYLELLIDTGVEDIYEAEPEYGSEVALCRPVMERGLLRDFIASLTQLRSLSVMFNFHSYEQGFPAALEDVIKPKHRWEHLEDLSLGNVECERQGLMSVLKRHKDTLESLELQDIRLKSTSWLALQASIRKHMRLVDAMVTGELYGVDEDMMMDELFMLEPADLRDELRDDLCDYLCGKRRQGLTRDDNSLLL
ncbi:hypothetical protein PG999_003140 [Apiospora kogelbergensis]|uniref:F-box domain-containing protein n=1 Tax=Apiospora kogelbergensis TaxID=1337665 RepID=A0AAW0RAG7_9PEZI